MVARTDFSAPVVSDAYAYDPDDDDFNDDVADALLADADTPDVSKPKGTAADAADAADGKDKPAAATAEKAEPKPVAIASPFGLIKALTLLSKELGTDFIAGNKTQEEALKLKEKLGAELEKLPKEILDGLASGDVKLLNKFLKDHGYTIELKPLANGEIGVVTTTQIEGQWAGKDIGMIKGADGKEYPGFELKGTRFYKVEGHDDPVVLLYYDEDTGIAVYATPYDGDTPGLDAAAAAEKLTPKSIHKPDRELQKKYDRVQLPKVDMDVSQTVDWLLGLKLTKGGQIGQAIAQTILKMNEKGFKAKEGLAIATTRGLEPDPTPYTINKPFLIWAVKDGVKYPIFATKAGYPVFKDPEKP